MGSEGNAINGVDHRPQVDVEQARELLESIAPKCEADLIATGSANCSNTAQLIMHFKTICSHDVSCPPGSRLNFLVCAECVRRMRENARNGLVTCSYCKCRMALLSHAVGSIEPL